jgi:hypothetical protein
MALKHISRPVDKPAYNLAVGEDELLQNMEQGRPALSMPNLYREPITGGIMAGQSYEGLGGWGSLVPAVDPNDIPYYGEPLGGG